MTLEQLNPIFLQLGSGGLLGFVVGYAVKKLLKIMLVLIGLSFLILQYLAYKGIVTIDYGKILTELSNTLTSLDIGSLNFMTTGIPFLASFLVGFSLGLAKG